jgi:glycosidase
MCFQYILYLSRNTLAMKRLILALSAMVLTLCLHAQLLTWSPTFPVEIDAAQSLVITLDANKGNKGLLNHPSGDVYVHIGVITNQNNAPSPWKYVKTTWGTTDAAVRAISLGDNKWSFTITGNLKTYFGVPANESISKIALLFRSGDGSKKQTNADGSDMYIPIANPNNLEVRLLEPAMQPLFTPALENSNFPIGTHTFKVGVNKPATVTFEPGDRTLQSYSSTGEHSFRVNYFMPGFYEVTIGASNGSTATLQKIQLSVGNISSPVGVLPPGVQDGINYEPGGTSAILVLHAPGKNTVSVIGDFNNWTENRSSVMYKTSDGRKFWIQLNGLTPGTEYGFQYKVDNNLLIADPYAEKVLEPGADQHIPAATYPNLKPYPTGKTTGIVSVLQTAAPAYTWSNATFTRPDKKGLVIYELLLRDFVGAHDWKTLKDTLSYFKRLGVNAIQLMPVMEFEGNLSWGYNTYQYFAPDKYYGTKNALKEFIDSCHQNGIAVILDVVPNHTYGPSPLRDLYRDANYRPTADNPWYNQQAPHAAINFGDDFNHESAATKYFFDRVFKHWITEYKIDGYRMDFTKGLTQKVTTSDGAMSAKDDSRIAILKAYADGIKAIDPNTYIILEHLASDEEERELANNGFMLWSSVWTQYQEAAMGWLPNSNFDRAIYTTKGFNSPHLVTFMESHDEERVTYKTIKYGNAAGSYSVKDTATALRRMELNAAFMLTIPGPKMIWQFGEVGYDISRCLGSTNGEDGNCDKKTDAKPIRWDYKNEARRQNVFNVYSGLNKLRFHPWYKAVFETGTVDHSLAGGFKWMKVAGPDNSRLVVVGNFDVNAANSTITFPEAGTWFDYFSNTTFSATGAPQTIALQPGEYRVYVNRNVNNVAVTPVINIPTSGTKLEAKVFPNPIQQQYVVELYVPQSGKTRFELLTITGQQVGLLQERFLQQGKHQVTLHRNGIATAAGTYYLKLSTTTAQKIIPITLQ